MDALPAWINRECWDGFVAMRTKIKKPLTERAKKMLLKRLMELHSKGHDVNACLEQSEFNCFQDVYELKDKSIARAQSTAVDETAAYRREQEAHRARAVVDPKKVTQLVSGVVRKIA